MAEGPDFLCIGLQKAGTGWLYDQLQLHPDFWMPPIKELHFLNKPFPSRKIRRKTFKALNRQDYVSERRVKNDQRVLDDRDRDFFEKVRASIGQPADLDRYARLFEQKGNLISGDVTPNYISIAQHNVESVLTRFPKVKVTILLRDPVQRAMSQIGMVYRSQKAPEETFRNLELFIPFFLSGPFTKRHSPTEMVDRWRSRLPDDQFAFFFFDDIVGRPEGLLRDILAFLAADPEKPSRFPARSNRKSNKAKPVFPQPIQLYLQEYFREELERSAEMFGGHAKDWLARYTPAYVRISSLSARARTEPYGRLSRIRSHLGV